MRDAADQGDARERVTRNTDSIILSKDKYLSDNPEISESTSVVIKLQGLQRCSMNPNTERWFNFLVCIIQTPPQYMA